MNSSIGSAARFGTLSWNIPDSVSTTINAGTNYFNMGGVLVEIIVIVFFITNFCQKTSQFRQSYFVIYTMGCFVDAAPKFLLFVYQYIYKNPVSYYTVSALQWYNDNFEVLCNFLLALNRFSAIIYPLRYKSIWSKRNTTIVCIFLVLYPFIIHSFNPLPIYYTFTRQIKPIGVKETDFEKAFVLFSNIAFSLLATILVVIAAVHIICKGQMKDKNIEHILLVQSFTSSTFLVVYSVTSWLQYANSDFSIANGALEFSRIASLQIFFGNTSKLSFSCHQYTSLALLIFASKSFREAFFKFLRITQLINKFKKNDTKVTVLHPSMAPPKKNILCFKI